MFIIFCQIIFPSSTHFISGCLFQIFLTPGILSYFSFFPLLQGCVCAHRFTSSLFVKRTGGAFWNIIPHIQIAACASSSPGWKNECVLWVGGWVQRDVWMFPDYSVVWVGIRLTMSAAWLKDSPGRLVITISISIVMIRAKLNDFMTEILNTDFVLFISLHLTVSSFTSFTECLWGSWFIFH